MSSTIAQWLGKKLIQDKILKERLENKFGLDDPYFEQVPATRLDGTPTGKFKKVRKALPPGISHHDAEILNKVKRRAYRLDMAFGSIFGIKFGWGSLIALFPVFGDFADAFLGLLVVRTAKQVEGGLPLSLRLSMYFWLLLDLIIGLIPFVGDIADAMVLANTRNAAALEAHLREKGRANIRSSGRPVPATDPSDPVEFDRLHSEPLVMSQPPGVNEGASGQSQGQHVSQTSGVAPVAPAPARTQDNRRARQYRNIFRSKSKRHRPTDIETGIAPNN
ncbi:hypothetical protein GGS21DRAFT_511673 [Xylaria nigripes]|nr:hypothetical protein GGS21DRAFT_511673 [Xylaria nigripes]